MATAAMYESATIGVAMALPAGLWLGIENLKTLGHNWHTSAQISLYLKNDVSNNQLQSLLTQLRNNSDIGFVQYISPSEGLNAFAKQTEFKNAIQLLANNPLPGVIVIQPKTTTLSINTVATLQAQLKTIQGIDQLKVDMAWIERLNGWLEFSQRLIEAVAVLLGLGILLVIGNTIYLAMQRHTQEIEIYKLVGGAARFIRRPFLYTGFWYGLGGGLLALIQINLIFWWLKAPLSHLGQSYGSPFMFVGLNEHFNASVLLAGVALGLVGSWLAVSYKLRITD